MLIKLRWPCINFGFQLNKQQLFIYQGRRFTTQIHFVLTNTVVFVLLQQLNCNFIYHIRLLLLFAVRTCVKCYHLISLALEPPNNGRAELVYVCHAFSFVQFYTKINSIKKNVNINLRLPSKRRNNSDVDRKVEESIGTVDGKSSYTGWRRTCNKWNETKRNY